MISFQNNDQKINISILDYEFPEITDDNHDSNWLMFDIEVFHREQYLRFRDPSMLTSELFNMYKWFKSLSENRSPCQSYLAFIEPNFFFRLHGRQEYRVEFSVSLGYFNTPGFWKKKDRFDVFFSYSLDELKALTKSIRAEYNKFPERLVNL